jgi:hypothetical protein
VRNAAVGIKESTPIKPFKKYQVDRVYTQRKFLGEQARAYAEYMCQRTLPDNGRRSIAGRISDLTVTAALNTEMTLLGTAEKDSRPVSGHPNQACLCPRRSHIKEELFGRYCYFAETEMRSIPASSWCQSWVWSPASRISTAVLRALSRCRALVDGVRSNRLM